MEQFEKLNLTSTADYTLIKHFCSQKAHRVWKVTKQSLINQTVQYRLVMFWIVIYIHFLAWCTDKVIGKVEINCCTAILGYKSSKENRLIAVSTNSRFICYRSVILTANVSQLALIIVSISLKCIVVRTASKSKHFYSTISIT